MKTRLGIACILFFCQAAAHELRDNRATLVLRDRTHIAATIYLSYSQALHQALAPMQPFPEFLAVYSAMKPEILQRQLQRAQTDFEAGTHLYLPSGEEVTLAHWIWPDAKRVQILMQQTTMQAVLDPNGHFHEEPVEIYADAVAPQEVAGVRVRFPQAFQKVLVVAYKPNQLWVEPNSLSPAIRF